VQMGSGGFQAHHAATDSRTGSLLGMSTKTQGWYHFNYNFPQCPQLIIRGIIDQSEALFTAKSCYIKDIPTAIKKQHDQGETLIVGAGDNRAIVFHMSDSRVGPCVDGMVGGDTSVPEP